MLFVCVGVSAPTSGTSTSVIAVRVVSSGHRTYDLGIALLSSSLHRCSLVCGERLMKIFLHALYLTIKKGFQNQRYVNSRCRCKWGPAFVLYVSILVNICLLRYLVSHMQVQESVLGIEPITLTEHFRYACFFVVRGWCKKMYVGVAASYLII